MSATDPKHSSPEPPSLAKGLAFGQARLAIILAFSLGFIFSCLQIYWDYQTQRSSFSSSIDHHVATMQGPATEALWYLNEDLAKGVIDGLFGFEPVIEGAIVNNVGYVLANRSKPKQEHAYRWLIQLLFGENQRVEQALQFQQDGQAHAVGKLVIVIDPYSRGIDFISRATTIMVTGLIRNLILAIGFFLLFYLNCTRQILDISRYLSRLNPAKPQATSLQAHKGHRDDEMGQLVDSVNQLVISVNQHGQQRQLAERALKETNLNQERIIDERTRELEGTVRRLQQQSTHVHLLGQIAAIANIESDPYIALRKSLLLLIKIYQGRYGAVLLYGEWAGGKPVKQHWFQRNSHSEVEFGRTLTEPEYERFAGIALSQLGHHTSARLLYLSSNYEMDLTGDGSNDIASLIEEGVDSLLLVPVLMSGEVVARLEIFIAGDAHIAVDTEEVLDHVSEQLTHVFERRQNENRLTILATTDPLTGIFNRRAFEDRASNEFQRASRHHRDLAMIIFDIDDFKRFNDTFGHAAGDSILMMLAKVTNQQLRTTDIFGRMGGEEFAVMLPECAATEVQEVAERIRTACQAQKLSFSGQTASVSLSLGVAMMAMHDRSFEEILSRADEALYKAKEAGKNRTWIYDVSSQGPVSIH
ncbi:MAG: diguanylate cyclase [Motiliproteus sp.]